MPSATIVNPYSREPIGDVDLVEWPTIDKWLDQAVELHRDQSQWLQDYQRRDVLLKMAEMIQERHEELAFQIANEGGKPMIDARVEVTRAISTTQQAAERIDEIMTGRQWRMGHTAAGAGHTAHTTKVPIGPVVAVCAFNHPLNLIAHQVATAIATGCPVLVKPADDTPFSARDYVDLAHKAGLPEEWCRFAPCEIPVAEQMVTDPRVGFFTFIGSAKVGWYLKNKLADGTRFALEHGGAAPVIVDPDYPTEELIPSLLRGGFYHAGQVCVSVQRVFAPRGKAREIATALAAAADKLKVGNAIEDDVDVGPLIRPREVDRVEEWVKEAVDGGAEVITGATRHGDTAYNPTVLMNPPLDSRISTLEVFGPVVCVYEVDDLDEQLRIANSTEWSFQASVYSNDIRMINKCVRELDGAAIMVNESPAYRVDWMPFAGYGKSGFGVGGVGYTMEDMVEEKMWVLKD